MGADLDDRGEPVATAPTAPAGSGAVTFGGRPMAAPVVASSRAAATAPVLFASRPNILVAGMRPASASAPVGGCADCGGAAPPVGGGVNTPAPLDAGFPGNQTDIVLGAPPLRGAIAQIGGLAVGEGFSKRPDATPASGGGFHLSMALVLLGVGLVALALWKLEA